MDKTIYKVIYAIAAYMKHISRVYVWYIFARFLIEQYLTVMIVILIYIEKKRWKYLIEEAFITCSTLAGAIFGTAVFPKLYKKTKDPAKGSTQRHLTKPHGFAKAELESLKFERSLLHGAITRIYEAVQEGRIDAMERDRLLLKYKRQLVIYDEKIDALLPLVDLSELNDMRDDVVNMLDKWI